VLTKAAAIERLRTTGTLRSGPAADNSLRPGMINTPLARKIDVLSRSNARASAPRHIAPSINQSVLP